MLTFLYLRKIVEELPLIDFAPWGGRGDLESKKYDPFIEEEGKKTKQTKGISAPSGLTAFGVKREKAILSHGNIFEKKRIKMSCIFLCDFEGVWQAGKVNF